MFEGFVNPALAAGAGLAAVPLLIHLLNRQRHRPMRWAAMRFVLAAYRRTRRRVQLENLFLLLLRMGAVALLALAVARPFAAGDGALGTFTERRRDVVLVLDASASTGYREDVETVFERIVERATTIVSGLDGANGDRVQVVVAGRWPRVFGWSDPEKTLSILSTLAEPTDEVLDLSAALAEVVELVEKDAAGTGQSGLELRLLTDLQRSVFAELTGSAVPDGGGESDPGSDDPTEAESPLVAEQLDALAELGTTLLVEDLGPAPTLPQNLSIAAVHPVEALYGPGSRAEIAVQVANHGASPRPAERVALSIDGNKLPVQRLDVPAQGQAEAVFSVELDAPGAHTLVAELDGDRLAIDDRRATVVMVPAPLSVLVVNGAPADDLDEDEVGYLMLALEPLRSDGGPGEDMVSPFVAREITPDGLLNPDLDLRGVDVVVLANVATLPDSVVVALEERVAAGASLIVALGDRIGDLRATNAKLFRPDGTGLLPAELVRRVSVARRDAYYRVAGFDEAHPIFHFFSDEAWKPLLTEVPVYEFVESRPLPDAKVLATLDDESGSPLLVERGWGQGRVFLWTTSLSKAWNDVPSSAKTLIPLAHEWLRYAGTRREAPRVVAPGDPLQLVVEGFPRSPELVRADGSRRTIDGEPVETADGRWRLPEVGPENTERVGLYTVTFEGARSEPFAVELDADEGDLARLAPDELRDAHPALQFLDAGARDRAAGDEGPRRGEVWRWLALFCLLALVCESVWGAWIGQRRRVHA